MRHRIFTLRSFVVGVTGSLALAALVACADFSAADEPPANTSEGGGPDAAAPIPSESGVMFDASDDAANDGPARLDGALALLFAEGFDNGCGMWAVPGTFGLAETKPRTMGACRVCPDSTTAMVRGTFTTARRGINRLRAWVRVSNTEGTGFPPPSTVTARLVIPQAGGPPEEGMQMVDTTQGFWTELTLDVLSSNTAIGEAATITITVSSFSACVSVDDLVVQ